MTIGDIGLDDHVSGTPSGPGGRPLTAEQADAVERREGVLLLQAGAGSGKTTVLVERIVRDVLETRGTEREIRLDQIVATTFTRKAAGELRERVRARFAELGEHAAARDCERAWITTIDGLCTRILRSHAVLAGLDPQFRVLDEADARELRAQAFADALDAWLDGPPPDGLAALELLAAIGYDELAALVSGVHDSLRNAGDERPRIPVPEPTLDPAPLAAELRDAAREALALLADASAPTAVTARGRLEACVEALEGGAHDPQDVAGWRPAARSALLREPPVEACRDLVDRYGAALAAQRSLPSLVLLDDLLRRYGEGYERAKRNAGALDFADLALRATRLLEGQPAVAAGYRRRLRRLLVDEFQDSNRLQLRLFDALGLADRFMVGDALQSIYGFRHADVEVFRDVRDGLADDDGTASLTTNFRSHAAILDVINAALGEVHGPGEYIPLLAPGEGPPAEPSAAERGAAAPAAHVELLITDESWSGASAEQLEPLLAGLPSQTSPTDAAEAALVAQRVREIVDAGEAAPNEIAVLVRAGAKLGLLERALGRVGLSAVAAQGRGWWERLEVLDLVAHLRTVANPTDEEALFAALRALAGVSRDTMALIALERRAGRGGGDARAWAATTRLAAGEAAVAVPPAQRELLARYVAIVDRDRAEAARLGPGPLLERVMRELRYDEALLRRPGGVRRLANARKLVRLAHGFAADRGGDVRALVDHAQAELAAGAATSDASIDVGETDAIRLMTVHGAKGLEFDVVVFADLGRGPVNGARRLLVDGGRAGLKVTTIDRREWKAFDYDDLDERRKARERAEEARIVHVAVTRARRRLVLSGITNVAASSWPEPLEKAVAPLRWMVPCLLRGTDALERIADVGDETLTVAREGWCAPLRLAVSAPRTFGSVLRPPAPGGGAIRAARPSDDASAPAGSSRREGIVGTESRHVGRDVGPARPEPASSGKGLPRRESPEAAADAIPVPSTLSYSSLDEHASCGYGWYLRRVLRLPSRESWDPATERPAPSGSARRRGTLTHALLERVALHSGAEPPEESEILLTADACDIPRGEVDVAAQKAYVAAFLSSATGARAAAAAGVDREVRFTVALEPDDPAMPLLVGSIDLLAGEQDGTALVVDHKTDAIDPDEDLAARVERDYGLQRAAYALAALAAGHERVEVVHLYLGRPDEPVSASFVRSDESRLRAALLEAAAPLLAGEAAVTDSPSPALCAECPGRGGLCSWTDEEIAHGGLARLVPEHAAGEAESSDHGS
ncbi:MAG: UvrD-helicase domain-containing protein [Solirubrobacteraceae bacterium]|nr:UvrD-helicase domain-containing protein [Solirubrobacteraceae bacterium]